MKFWRQAVPLFVLSCVIDSVLSLLFLGTLSYPLWLGPLNGLVIAVGTVDKRWCELSEVANLDKIGGTEKGLKHGK